MERRRLGGRCISKNMRNREKVTSQHGAAIRMRLAAAAGLVLLLSSVTPTIAGTVEEDFVAGSGKAYAQVVRVGPTAARLSLAPVVGLTLADFTDTVARGAAADADLAAIGIASPCTDAQVPRVRVSSEDKGAEQGKTNSFGGPPGSGVGTLFARATKSPFAESRFKFGDLEIPALMTIGKGVGYTSSGIVSKGVRQSKAAVDISDFSFGGVVTLTGLHWEAVQQTTGGDKQRVTASFTMQGASIGDLPIPASDLGSALKSINEAIAPTGFSISLPVDESAAGVAAMSPLQIQIVNSPLGRQFLAPVLAAVQPIREPLADELIPILKQPKEIVGGNPNDCDQTTVPDLSVAVLAADLGIGVAAGSSELHIELGGVNAFTEGETFDNPFGGIGVFRPPGAVPPQTVFTPGTSGRPAVPGTPSEEGTLVASPAGPAGERTIPGGKGGVAIAVGMVGLAAAIALAVADWRRMRAGGAAA